jgi:hypothetical protein
MRVRILKPSEGIVDGVSLSQLAPGLIYDVKPITARYLISRGCAEELTPADAKLVTPPDNPTFFSQAFGGIHVTMPRAEAADRSRTRRKKR